MKNYRIEYILENEEVIPVIDKKIKIGKYTFSPAMSEKGFHVSYLVRANSMKEAQSNTTSNELANIFSLFERRGVYSREKMTQETRYTIKKGKKTKQFSQSFQMKTKIKYKVDIKSLKFCCKSIAKLHKFSDGKQTIIKRSLHFFSRGANDFDPTDEFLDYWIAFENLLKLYSGKTNPAKCVKCGHVYEPRPLRSTLQHLLIHYGLKSKLKEFNELNQLRADLVHARLDHITSKDATKTQNLVKSLLLKILG